MTEANLVEFEGHWLVKDENEVLMELIQQYHIKFQILDHVLLDTIHVIIDQNHVKAIGLPNLNLNEIPSILRKLSNLRFLSLNNNYITQIPSWILEFNKLSKLNLTSNEIEVFNYEFLPDSLKIISLNKNKIKEIPYKNKSNNLIEIYLNTNNLSDLPEMIKDCNALKTLVLNKNPLNLKEILGDYLFNLENIDLSNCNLTIFPNFLLKIPTLTKIYLDHNKIKSFPIEIVQLPKIKNIYLKFNELNNFPDLMENDLNKIDFDNTTFCNQKYPSSKIAEFNLIRLLLKEKCLKIYNGQYEIISLPYHEKLQKISFDRENMTMQPEDSLYPATLVGLHSIDNQAFLGISAGGDWEFPIFFILFEVRSKFKIYIPEMGNAWNGITNRAFGNDRSADLEYLQSYWEENDLDDALLQNPPKNLDSLIEALINEDDLLEDIRTYFFS